MLAVLRIPTDDTSCLSIVNDLSLTLHTEFPGVRVDGLHDSASTAPPLEHSETPP